LRVWPRRLRNRKVRGCLVKTGVRWPKWMCRIGCGRLYPIWRG